MRSISKWARRNKWSARVLITFCFIFLYILGYSTGNLLNELEVTFGSSFFLATLLIYIITSLLYPGNKKPGSSRSIIDYYRQKACDMLLAAVLFLFMVFVGNRPDQAFRGLPGFGDLYASSLPLGDSNTKTYKSAAEFSAAIKDVNGKLIKWKERKKLLKQQIKAVNNSDMSTAGKVALILLSIAAAIGAMYLIGAASCSLACNDQGFLAVVVLLGGSAVVSFFLVKAIKSILKKRAPSEPAP